MTRGSDVTIDTATPSGCRTIKLAPGVRPARGRCQEIDLPTGHRRYRSSVCGYEARIPIGINASCEGIVRLVRPV